MFEKKKTPEKEEKPVQSAEGDKLKDPVTEAVNSILNKVDALEEEYEAMLDEFEKMDRAVVKAL